MKWLCLERILTALLLVSWCCWTLASSGQDRFKRRSNLIHEAKNLDPELHMSPPELIRHRGYPVEVHKVVTADGYILELHRIPPRLKPTKASNSTSYSGHKSKAVYLHHGLLATSGRFLRPPSNRALAFMLSDRGYDVWLGNSRGNTYSRQHVSLDPDDLPYWDFSWDEMGHMDIPASLGYVLRISGHKKLSIVCLSFGCTLYFIAATVHPKLNDQVDVLIALAPSTRVANMRQPIFNHFIVPFYGPIRGFYQATKTRAYGDINTGPVKKMLAYFCRKQWTDSCHKVDNGLDNLKTAFLEKVPGADRHFPTGTSIRSMTQFVQNIRGKGFQAYDFGAKGNLAHYGTVEPLDYGQRLYSITCPTYIFWSPNDIYATQEDVAWLAARLGNVKASTPISDPSYDHFDFITAENVNQVINYPVMALLPPPF